MDSLDSVHKRLLDEWKKESKRDLSQITSILKNAKIEMHHKKLMKEWKKATCDKTVVGGTLGELKELMNSSEALKGLDEAALHTIHRDVYEIDALLAILNSDLSRFGDAITVVMNFYNCFSSKEESTNKYLMIGLQLMYLLATNQHAQFQMMLEQIEPQIQQNNAYISTPVKLEQSIMEGVYSKIVLTERNIPSPYYAVFVRIAMDTIRDEIASCIEISFKKVSIKDATQLLLFTNPNDVTHFANKRGWRSSNGVFFFEIEQAAVTVPKAHLDTKRITKQSIFYAKQLEMIV